METDDWLAENIRCEMKSTKLFEVNWMEGKFMRVEQRESQALVREYEVSALNESSASESGSFKIIWSGQLSHVTEGVTKHTTPGHYKNDRKQIWRRHTNSYKKQVIRRNKF